MGLLAWLDRKLDERIARHVTAAAVLPMPARRHCAVCTGVLIPGQAFLCTTCQRDSNA